jgi:hypothetical protein
MTTLKESISALSGAKGGSSVHKSSGSIANNHECHEHVGGADDATTHEDRKTSASSDVHFGDHTGGCGTSANLEIDHPISPFSKKPSPLQMGSYPVNSHGTVGVSGISKSLINDALYLNDHKKAEPPVNNRESILSDPGLGPNGLLTTGLTQKQGGESSGSQSTAQL